MTKAGESVLILTATANNEVLIWEILDDKLVQQRKRSFEEFKSPITSMIGAQEKYVVLGLESGSIVLWEYVSDTVNEGKAHPAGMMVVDLIEVGVEG